MGATCLNTPTEKSLFWSICGGCGSESHVVPWLCALLDRCSARLALCSSPTHHSYVLLVPYRRSGSRGRFRAFAFRPRARPRARRAPERPDPATGVPAVCGLRAEVVLARNVRGNRYASVTNGSERTKILWTTEIRLGGRQTHDLSSKSGAKAGTSRHVD